MASFLAKYNGVDIIDLGEGWNVTLKRNLPGHVIEQAEAAKVRSTAQADQEVKGRTRSVKVETTQDMSGYTDILLMEAIMAWNLTDLNEEIMPLAPRPAKLESIHKLPADVRAQLREHIEKEHEARSEEDQAAFRESGEVSTTKR